MIWELIQKFDGIRTGMLRWIPRFIFAAISTWCHGCMHLGVFIVGIAAMIIDQMVERAKSRLSGPLSAFVKKGFW